uniref:DNA polymerase delta small subunit n=2 Tax=Parascaris TaxID=6254 RepID=A0A915AL58_PARUN
FEMVQLTRDALDYENRSMRFLIDEKDLRDNCFQRQYFHAYRARVSIMRPKIIAAAKEKFGNNIEPCNLTKAVKSASSFVIGTVEKRIKLRPSVLRDLAEEQLILPKPILEDRLVTDEDFLEFEDENQIVRLTGAIDMDDVATGCVIGLRGTQLKEDKFRVDEIIWPKMAIQPPLPQLATDKYLMFISGLSFSGESDKDAERLFSLDLLQKWIGGYLPLCDKERSLVENIVRLVVAGESVAITDQGREFTTAARYVIKNEECPNVECAAHMDKFLAKISSLLEVDVMPGLGDPATHLMPQQPIHRAVFPNASYHGKMLNLVTNPYHFTLNGIHIMGTSGNNVSDLKRFSTKASSTDILERTLLWQHLAPTIPDTVDGFPFIDRDPFIIEDTFPHILFAANQSAAESAVREFEGGRRTLLVSVPSFAKTKSALLINLRTLEVIEQNFTFDDDMIS